jgi:hypothetical protein
MLQNEAGRSNIIDFEQILKESQIIPSSNLSNSNEGCGAQNILELPLSGLRKASTGLNSANNVVTTPPLTMVRIADDDIAAHVPSSLKQQICKGEYINLALLLKGAVELSEFCSGSVFRLNANGQIETAQKECKESIFDIEKWTNAFIIYMSVYLSAHADKMYEMLHYMFNIRECALRQGGVAWRTYDEQFRLRQAISPASWSKINNDLWWRCMQLRPLSKAPSSSVRYPCNDFNRGSCSWRNCKFAHVCNTCAAPHPEFACTKNQSSTSGSFNQFKNKLSSESVTPPQKSFRASPFYRRGDSKNGRKN